MCRVALALLQYNLPLPIKVCSPTLSVQQIVAVNQHFSRIWADGGVRQLQLMNQQPRFNANWLVLADLGEFKFVGHVTVPPILFQPRTLADCLDYK